VTCQGTNCAPLNRCDQLSVAADFRGSYPAEMKSSSGKVYLVGAGPGDLGLVTMRAMEVLKKADVVVYDALINQELLKFARSDAEIIYGGKRSNNHAIPQDQLNELLVEKARLGKTVVRLKGGDPYVFGRGAEEAGRLQAAGIPFEVVPGISSVIAGPNYAGIPITHRDHCSSFSVITGHEDPEKPEGSIDWNAVAKMPGTKVILMGVERIREISQKLIINGLPDSTPAAMVRWGTTGRQQTIQGTLATIAKLAEDRQFKAPAVTIIGEVVQLRSKLNWFENRPLFGQRIVVTRTREQASELSSQLRELGAEILEIPTIKIVAPEDHRAVVDAILGLNSYSWIVFTSPNGVSMFFDFFFKAFEDLRDIGGVRIAAVGPATAAKLKELHLKVDVTPEKYLASEIAEAMNNYESLENLSVLLLRAEVANQDLPEKLVEIGAIVDDVACYKTVPETTDITGVAEDFTGNGADWITFTSSSTVESFHQRFDLVEVRKKFPKIRLASIGPETSKALVHLGFQPDVEATKHSIPGLVEILKKVSKTAHKQG